MAGRRARTRESRSEGGAGEGSRRASESTPDSPSSADAGSAVRPRGAIEAAPLGQESRAQEALALQATHGNQYLQRLLEGGTAAARAPEDADAEGDAGAEAEPMDLPTAIGYIGMNPQAWKEARGLERRARDVVITSLDDPALAEGLETPEGRVSFLMNELALHPFLDFAAFIRAWEALETVEVDAREQYAQLMQMFRGAEQGKYVLERLVMSGHSDGVELWGEEEGDAKPGGIVLARELENLTKTFPDAAAQIQDVMFSACFSANAIELVQRVFPNLQTAWGYADFSPSIAQGSVSHIGSWERATRDEQEPGERSGRGSSTIWTREEGYVVGDPGGVPIETAMEEANMLADVVGQEYLGEEPLDQDVLREHYMALQRLIRHPEAAPANVAAAEEQVPKVLRLRFWSKVCGEFASAYADEIRAAYDELGIKAPDFAGITRATLKSQIAAYDAALSGKDAPAAVAFRTQQLEGLWTLHPAFIPTDWI